MKLEVLAICAGAPKRPGGSGIRARASRYMAILIAGAFLVAACQLAALAWASESHRIVQKDRSFQVQDVEIKEVDIAAGDTLEFLNNDIFLHQIYVASGGLKFDSAEQPPGEIIAIKFPSPGTYEIRCHIHPKMSLTVTAR
jgi:plastocyanin